MSTATLQERIAKRRAEQQKQSHEMQLQQQRRVQDFVPPDVTEGMDVLWFERADPHRPPFIATVMAVRGKLVNVSVQGAQRMYANVRHIDDPALEGNSVLCEPGGWSYTPAYEAEQRWKEALAAQLDALADRVQTLERRLEIVDKKASK